MLEPLVSICIPAYQKPHYVVRLLDSVLIQNYKNVEIVISDDSPGEDTRLAIETYRKVLTIHYFHNQPSLKTPRNWNNALDKSSGDLLVLMHQDDWYHSPNALSSFVTAFQDKNVDFVFCRNTAINKEGKVIILQAIPSLLNRLTRTPNHLVIAQVIGPPGNTMLRKSVNVRYDERFIWLVDVDYYVRILKMGYRYHYINQHLVSIGIHDDQTTEFCRSNPNIIFKENIWFAGKLELIAFEDILVYDYFWRLLRNFGIKNLNDFKTKNIEFDEIPTVMLHMLSWQKRMPTKLLQIGVISKMLMTVSFLKWKLYRSEI